MKGACSASILSADLANLSTDVQKILCAGITRIHFDVMDHHYVPNLSFGPCLCKALHQAHLNTPIDVHLMVDEPECYIESFAESGASSISFHPETAKNSLQLIQWIHDLGMQAGWVFNPNQCPILNADAIKNLDLLLLMSVYPGFSGQKFIRPVLNTVRAVRTWLNQQQLSTVLGVDGGLNLNNIGEVAQMGCEYFVLGSGLFEFKNDFAHIQKLQASVLKEDVHVKTFECPRL